VGANTFRNPGLMAKLATTLDHISEGRAILGLGGAWFEHEHVAHGIEFGTGFGQRLDWLHEAVGAIRTVLDGGVATSSENGRYRFRELRQHPLPLQARLPIMIGGSGEKKTLRTVATYADMWNAMGSAEVLRHKVEVLREHCAAVGRDISAIEMTVACKPLIRDTEAEARRAWEAQMALNRTPMAEVRNDETFWIGTAEQIAERMRECRAVGFDTFIAELAAPHDVETLERWIGEVKPMLEA
jgi:alkanesulfonate monooxygenase SsuD/methylene tetrahydromethanopterin reductase-like flavin-dependent oxidoreductase (luciferase family)